VYSHLVFCNEISSSTLLQLQIREVISGMIENGLWFDHLTKGKRETVSSFSYMS
jgi:hypothetical protein